MTQLLPSRGGYASRTKDAGASPSCAVTGPSSGDLRCVCLAPADREQAPKSVPFAEAREAPADCPDRPAAADGAPLQSHALSAPLDVGTIGLWHEECCAYRADPPPLLECAGPAEVDSLAVLSSLRAARAREQWDRSARHVTETSAQWRQHWARAADAQLEAEGAAQALHRLPVQLWGDMAVGVGGDLDTGVAEHRATIVPGKRNSPDRTS